jgi:hypothetical protein
MGTSFFEESIGQLYKQAAFAGGLQYEFLVFPGSGNKQRLMAGQIA